MKEIVCIRMWQTVVENGYYMYRLSTSEKVWEFQKSEKVGKIENKKMKLIWTNQYDPIHHSLCFYLRKDEETFTGSCSGSKIPQLS